MRGQMRTKTYALSPIPELEAKQAAEIESLRAQLAAVQKSLKDAEAECERLCVALRRIEKWFGEFPPVTDRDGKPSEYGTQYGSNGERDYMRSVARDAIAACPATTGGETKGQ